MEGLLNGQCAAQSVGPANQLFALLVQTILAAQCTISPPDMWPKDYGPTALERGLDEYDFVIVGAGSAGSVVANRLSENPDWKVLLLEAGGDPPIESEIPFMQTHLLKSPVDWLYYAGAEDDGHERRACRASTSPDGCYWPRGKMLGGSGAMNAMVYLRGNARDYDRWESRGNPGWSWQSVLPYFRKSEDNRHLHGVGDGQFHGTGGYLTVTSATADRDSLHHLLAAARANGYDYLRDFNAERHIGFGTLQMTTVNGTRCSPAKAFLVPVKHRPNLHIIKHAHATKVEFDDGQRVTAVRFILAQKKKAQCNVAVRQREMRVRVRRETIVSAGAVNTPQLLMLSGIGPEEDLRQFGIPLVSHLPVGHKLEDHVFVPLFYRILQSTANDYNVDRDLLAPSFAYLMHRDGPLADSGLNAYAGFVNTDNHTDRFPNVQYHHVHWRKRSVFASHWFRTLDMNERVIESVQASNNEADLLTILVILLKPKSSGQVRLRSSNAQDKPMIDAGYLSQWDDLRVLIEGIRIQQRIMAAEAAQPLEPEPMWIDLPTCDGEPYDSDAYWECYAREMTLTLYHPVGTAKMGPQGDPDAVVDARLRVKGVHGLRVIDASVMPEIVSGNTNAPVIMIAEKASDMVKEDHGPSYASVAEH